MFNNKQLSKVQFYKYFNKTFNTWHCEVHASRRCPHVTEVDLCAEKRLTIYVYVERRCGVLMSSNFVKASRSSERMSFCATLYLCRLYVCNRLSVFSYFCSFFLFRFFVLATVRVARYADVVVKLRLLVYFNPCIMLGLYSESFLRAINYFVTYLEIL